jgi:hypothetical protein
VKSAKRFLSKSQARRRDDIETPEVAPDLERWVVSANNLFPVDAVIASLRQQS